MDNLPPEIQQFLKRFGAPQWARPAGPESVITGEGSGFFISADGYIVTNNHVVENAKTVTVTMDDGKILDAKVIGTDPKTDLALLKVDEKGDYPFVSFAKESRKIGDWVVAIGNPYGLGGTVTAGIISAEGRDIGDGPYDRFLQIDAPINKGNSGGPTFNMKGEVVGVNTAIYSPSGGSVGIGFAIPASTVDNVVNALEHGGVVSRGYLGVMIQPVTPEIAESLGLKTADGAMVDQAEPGTPAAEAGLKSGDVITKLNGKTVKDAGDLTPSRRLAQARRQGRARPICATAPRRRLTSRSPRRRARRSPRRTTRNAKRGAPTLGIELAPAKQIAGAGDKGVAIIGVDPNGAAAAKGLTAGDVILDVAGKPVSTPQDVKSRGRERQEPRQEGGADAHPDR